MRDSEVLVLPIVVIYVAGGGWAGGLVALLQRWMQTMPRTALVGLIAALPIAAGIALTVAGLGWSAGHTVVMAATALLGPVVAVGVKVDLDRD